MGGQLVKLDDGDGFEALPDGMKLLCEHGASKNVRWHEEYYTKDPNYLQVKARPTPHAKLPTQCSTKIPTGSHRHTQSLDR